MASAERQSQPARALFTAAQMLGYFAELDDVLAEAGTR